jgi:hypothetical protein
MNQNNLITQIISRSDTLLYFWLALVAMGLVVLALAARPNQHPSLPRLLFFGFAFFAVTHLMCMQWILKQWQAAAEALQKIEGWKLANPEVKADLMTVLPVPAFEWVLPFHLAFDAFVLGGLWWLSRKR